MDDTLSQDLTDILDEDPQDADNDGDHDAQHHFSASLPSSHYTMADESQQHHSAASSSSNCTLEDEALALRMQHEEIHKESAHVKSLADDQSLAMTLQQLEFVGKGSSIIDLTSEPLAAANDLQEYIPEGVMEGGDPETANPFIVFRSPADSDSEST